MQSFLSGPAAKVVGGSSLGQLALICSIPAISRLYDAAEVGTFAVWLSVSQMVAIVLTGRMEQILPRAEVERRWAVAKLVLLLIAIPIPVGIALAALLLPSTASLAVIALAVATSMFNLSGYVLLSTKNYTSLARSRGINGVATAVLQVLGGLIAPSALTLSVAYAVASLAGAAMCLPDVYRLRSSSSSQIVEALRLERAVRFVATLGPSGLLSNAAVALPTLGVASLYGLDAAATFFLVRRALLVPSQLISRTLSDLNYAELVAVSPDRVGSELRAKIRMFRWPVAIASIGGLMSAPLLQFVVGRQYHLAGYTMAVLLIPTLVQLVAVSFSTVLLILGREVITLVWNVARVATLGLLYSLLQPNPNYAVDIVAFSVYLTVVYGCLLVLTLRVSRLGARG